MKRLLTVLTLLCSSLAWAQIAVPNPHPSNPMIELGAGYEQEMNEGDENLLVEVQLRPRLPGPRGIDPGTQSFRLRLEFTGSLDVNGDSGNIVPAMRIKLVPLELTENDAASGRTLFYRSIGFAPVNVWRESRIGRDLSLRVNVLAVRAEYQMLLTNHFGLIAGVVAEALGYKLIEGQTSLGDVDHMNSLSLGNLEVGFGLLFRHGRAVNVTLYFGTQADAAIELSGLRRTSTDHSTFAQLQVNIAHRALVFARLIYSNALIDGQSIGNGALQVMAGARVFLH